MPRRPRFLIPARQQRKLLWPPTLGLSGLPAFRFSALLAFALSVPSLHAGLSFDTGMAPEEASVLLASADAPSAPPGSWLRLRDMDRSAVPGADGKDASPWPGVNPAHPIAERRQALVQLRAKGFHLVALIGWPTDSWAGGVRTDNPLRRLPYDLREAFARGRALTATYGDLIDYWEIGNEPDISFIEENPETYAAFLKACYLGIAAGRRRTEDGEQRTEDGGRTPVNGVQPSGAPALRPPSSVSTRSRVLMAPLALPPGPYLEGFLANDGLRYTDGFNYHYYGYAEDFTGVYEQFRAAVAEGRKVGDSESQRAGRPEAQKAGKAEDQKARESEGQKSGAFDTPPSRPSDPPAFRPSGLSPLDSTLSTQFYPNTTGWNAMTVATFDHLAEAARTNHSLLTSRPLAVGEPALTPDGRWLVTPGVTVEETAEGWKFHITALPDEPLRPAMAELPLPDGWKPGSEALLSFEYRILRTESQIAGRPEDQKVGESDLGSPKSGSPPVRPSGFPASGFPVLRPSGLPASPAERELPVFLTEYGYGLLGKDARSTPEGRARQAAWFSSVQTQIHALGIEGAMAFLLTPYLEADWNEFGLLVAAGKEPSRDESREPRAEGSGFAPGADQPFQLSAFNFQPSAALAALVSDSRRPIKPVTWNVPAAATPPAIVLDFVAGTGLAQAKSYAGYFMTGDYGRAAKPAEGQLVAYNVGAHAISGELHLDSDAWALSDGSHVLALTLNPNERREIPVQITPTLRHFAPQPARVTFHPLEVPAKTATSNLSPSKVRPSGLPALRPSAAPLPVQTAGPLHADFETYLRTANGNLYQTWPRPTATENWRPYSERLGNFTMAFFGRARLPWRLAENTPAALVFFFRPGELPLTFEIRRPRVVEFSAP